MNNTEILIAFVNDSFASQLVMIKNNSPLGISDGIDDGAELG